MSEDEFNKLFKYVEKRFNEMDKKFDTVHDELTDIRGAIGELSA